MRKSYTSPTDKQLEQILNDVAPKLGTFAHGAKNSPIDGFDVIPAGFSERSKTNDVYLVTHFSNLLGEGGINKVYFGWQIERRSDGVLRVIEVAVRVEKKDGYALLGEDIHRKYKSNKNQYEAEFIDQPALAISHTTPKIVSKELMTLGDLHDFSFDSSKSLIGAVTTTLMGIEFLHRNNIAHRDIKSKNVLIKKRGVAVSTDFDMAGNSSDKGFVGGTPGFYIPEEAQKQQNEAGDMFAVGCTIEDLLVKNQFAKELENNNSEKLSTIDKQLENPYLLLQERKRLIKQRRIVRRLGQNLQVLDPKLEPLYELVKDLKSIDPQKRPTAAQALERLLNMGSDSRFIYKGPNWQEPKRSHPDFNSVKDQADYFEALREIQKIEGLLTKSNYFN